MAPSASSQRAAHAEPTAAGQVWYTQFAHDGERLASASADKTIVVRSILSEKVPRVLRVLAGHTDAITCVAWSRDDRHLVSCAKERIKLWNPDTGEEIREFQADSEAITALAWLDSMRFVSGSKRIHVWQVGGGRVPVPPGNPASTDRARLHPCCFL